MGLIARAFDIFNHLPLISGANHFLGALLGVLQGCLVLFLAAAVLGLLISLTGGWPGVNSEVISQSYLFNIFYNIINWGRNLFRDNLDSSCCNTCI